MLIVTGGAGFIGANIVHLLLVKYDKDCDMAAAALDVNVG